MRTLSIFIVVLCSVHIQCARILVVSPNFNYNLRNLYTPLWLELAKNHQITLLTSGSIEWHENITQMDFFSKYEGRFRNARSESGGLSYFPYTNAHELRLMSLPDMVNEQFNDSDFHDLVRHKDFDLMFLDMIMPSWPCLRRVFNCPLIIFSTKDASAVIHDYMGNSIHPGLYPWQENLAAKFVVGYWDRLKSTGYTIINYFFTHFITIEHEKILLRKYFGTFWWNSFKELKNTSLLFINANPIFYSPRPVTPTTINLNGFLSITNPKKLPEDLQKYLDESEHGCIYVSFGTTVNSKYLSEEQKQTLVQAFQDMAPMRVLWKFDDVNVAKNVKNIEVRTWLPQQDVLRHRNLKLFVTQGGLQSMEEAIDSAVPMLGMPFYGDQYNNVLKMKTKKFGLSMDIKDMTRESLTSALKELLNNPIYRANINKYSAISKDQPMRGLEKAVWWTEYVLRHGGTEHLRSPSADIPLYQYFFLDILAVTSVFIYIFYVLMKYFYRMMMKLTYKYIFYPLLYKPKAKKE